MKKKKLVLFLFLMIGVLSLIFTYKFKQNNLNKNKPVKEEKLSIMIKEDGATDYTKSSSKDIPKGNYTLNTEKSYCKNNGKIEGYDSVTGTVSFAFIGTDRCFLYFDYISDISFETLMTPNNTDIFNENGLRYEGKNPNNYICLDNQTSGTCSDSSLLFRIIGLFDEEYSTDGTNSSGTKKLLKIIDTNNYGGDDGTNGKKWNSSGTNNWSTASLKTELNGTYLDALLSTSNVNSKLSSAIAIAKWHLGGPSADNYSILTAEGFYTEERNTSAIYSGNPSSIYAKAGLIYPSDYGYATVGGSTKSKSGCSTETLYDWEGSLYSDCKNNDWLFTSQSSFVNSGEWLLSPYSSDSIYAAVLNDDGGVDYNHDSVDNDIAAVRPTFYLDSSILKIVGTGDGTTTNAYRIG